MATKKLPTRVLVAKEELEKMTKEDLQKCWLKQEQYLDHIETKLNASSEQSELASLRESEEKLKQQQLEATRRENILVMRLTTKEQEMQEYGTQIQELKQAQIPSVAQLRSALLDPAVNLLFERMRKEMDGLKARLEETQNELSAWKFTPDSNTGKRLMAKCRLLYQENEELGKMISSGRMAKLEGDLALQKSFSEEMKKSQSELDEFLLELDEDVEGMQSTIYYLQQQLREAKDQVLQLQKDKQKLVGLPNGSPTNHRLSAPESESDNHSSLKPHRENDKSFSSPSFMSNDVNIHRPLNISNDRSNSHRPWTPPPPDPDETMTINQSIKTEDPNLPNEDEASVATAEEPSKSNKLLSSPRREANVQSVIVENVTNKNVDQSSVKRTNVVVDGLETSNEVDVLRTNDHETVLIKTEKETKKSSIATTKRTSESNRGRKRTRSRTPVEKDVVEETTIRKRTRRREAENKKEEKRTALEIDTDTEVQVAQTLASWASAKQERKELTTETSVGNGEIKSKRNAEK